MNEKVFWARNIEKYHLRRLWRFIVFVMVRRWHRSAAAEGRWGSLTKGWVTECVTDRRSHYCASCWFVMKIGEVVPVPKFQEFKSFGTESLDGPLSLWRSVIPAVEGNEESSRRNYISVGRWSPWWSVVTTTIRCKFRRPSRILTDFQQIESFFD